jgi:nucleoid-associated protein YgaU
VRSITPYERFGESNPDADAFLEEYSVKAGDTISGIAHRFYGDWRLWRLIADRNALVDVRELTVGATLLIPRKPLEQGRYEST